jgi:hypothetical protein
MEKYQIRNTKVRLTLILKIFETQGNVIITMPLPINYPTIDIGNSSEIKKEGLFYASVSFLPQANSYAIMTEEVKNIRMTYEELSIFNRIGKQALCMGFPYMLAYYNLNIGNTLVFLEAS